MKDRVHIATLAYAVEYGTRYIGDALADDPPHGTGRQRVDQWLQCHKQRQAESDEAERLHIAVSLKLAKAHERAHECRSPHEDEQRPSPIAFMTQADEGDGRIGTRDMPVDGGMVPLAETFLPRRPGAQRMIGRRGDIASQHAYQIEDDTGRCPPVAVVEAIEEKDHADHHAKQDAAGMRPGIPKLLLMIEKDMPSHKPIRLVMRCR